MSALHKPLSAEFAKKVCHRRRGALQNVCRFLPSSQRVVTFGNLTDRNCFVCPHFTGNRSTYMEKKPKLRRQKKKKDKTAHLVFSFFIAVNSHMNRYYSTLNISLARHQNVHPQEKHGKCKEKLAHCYHQRMHQRSSGKGVILPPFCW